MTASIELSVSSESDLVSSQVVGLLGRTLLVVSVALHSQASVLLARAGQASSLSSLVDGVADPVDARVISDGVVSGIDEDDFKVLEDGVLSGPVGVEDSEGLESSANAFFGDRLQVLVVLEASDSDGLGLSVDSALLDRSLATASADTDSVDDVSLLGAVAESAGLLDARGLAGAVDGGQLSVLPVTNTADEAEDFALLLLPEFL